MRTTNKVYDNSNSSINNSGLPSAADAGNYFYLPALGFYYTGRLNEVGNDCRYWSSSATSWSSYYAYYLHASSWHVAVNYTNGYNGNRAEALQ